MAPVPINDGYSDSLQCRSTTRDSPDSLPTRHQVAVGLDVKVVTSIEAPELNLM